MRIRLATRKHRIGVERIQTVIANAHTVEPVTTDRGEPGIAYVGLDNRGRELRVIVVDEGDHWLVIHAQPTSYISNWEEQ